MLLSHPRFYAVVAEMDGRIVGSNLLAVLARAAERSVPGVRLVQIAWHYRSLALYTKLGFETRETLSAFQGPTLGVAVEGYPVRPATEADLDACTALCRWIHGADRSGELADAIARSSSIAVG
jgi:hypothetical protein